MLCCHAVSHNQDMVTEAEGRPQDEIDNLKEQMTAAVMKAFLHFDSLSKLTLASMRLLLVSVRFCACVPLFIHVWVVVR